MSSIARADAYPETARPDTYRDTGCEVAPRCLECPLPECRYVVIDQNIRIEAQRRRRERERAIRRAEAQRG